MKRRLVVILALIVILPLAGLGYLGTRVALNEREATRSRFREVLTSRLKDIDAQIAALLAERERIIFADRSVASTDTESMREASRHTPWARQFFVLDSSGQLVYPPAGVPRTQEEDAFLLRTEHVWTSGGLMAGSSSDDRPFQAAGKTRQSRSISAGNGWYAYFWGDGLNLMAWRRQSSGEILGAELNMARLTADIIAALPSGDQAGYEGVSVALHDSRGQAIYEWGSYSPEKGQKPEAALAVTWPLSSWTLEYYLPPGYAIVPGRGVLTSLGLGLAALALVIVGLATYYYRETTREMREAAQRVSFVNQVSHELKTPLTNIRMYAELLAEDLSRTSAEENSKAQRYLDVIVTESQRLSRLIGNVLTFGRKQRGALSLHRAPARLDEILQAIVHTFEPSLRAKGLELRLNVEDNSLAMLDADAIQQMVGNLLNNAEKYASTGKSVGVSSRRFGENIEITVDDDGPGIPPREASRIFSPFYRISNNLNDGVAGAGIGLTIARDLARLHGGDLTVEPSDKGARFRVTLHAPKVETGKQ